MLFPFRHALQSRLPRWLVSAPGSQLWSFVAVLGEELDRVAYFAKRSWECWLVAYAPKDTLPAHGNMRLLPRYPLDTDDSYRVRLWSAFEFYRYLGTSRSIVDTFAILGYRAEVICEKDWDAIPDQTLMWNRFWVKIWGIPAESWDQPSRPWDETGAQWDAPVANSLRQQMIAIVLRGRSCKNRFEGFIYVQEDGSYVFEVLQIP